MRQTFLILGAGALLLAAAVPGRAAIVMPRSVIGSGAGGGAGGGYQINGTVGQAAIGRLGGPTWLHEAGFWSGPPVPTAAATVPNNFWIGQNYPNPFNPTTTIRYGLAKAGPVELSLYDPTGRRVAVLVNENQAAGVQEVTLKADDLASGVYFYRLVAGDFRQTRKLVLMK
ncbi:T9SS type A sorting domain-containing protein [bacterium]|nr:T9SS type A sorting domain-containing protein [bacterium]